MKSLLMKTCCTVVTLALLSFALSLEAAPKPAAQILNSKLFHLGDNDVNLVPGSSFKPEGERLDLKFSADKTRAEMTLEITYWDINNPTAVEINGQKLGTLPASKDRKEVYLRVPAK